MVDVRSDCRAGEMPLLAVRSMRPDEVHRMVGYFHDAGDAFLAELGADRSQFPTPAAWEQLVRDDMDRPARERSFDYLGWEVDGRPIGHCNINKIEFGHLAFLHLHVWEPQDRGRGIGRRLVAASVDAFFTRFELATIYSEPHALNPAPNRTLARVGFRLERTYETTPGWINVHQTVNRWRLDRDDRPAVDD